MNALDATRADNAGSGYSRFFFNSTVIVKQIPIYGNIRPDCEVCFIYTSLRDSEKAEAVNSFDQKIAAVILLPDVRPNLQIWRVAGLHCLIIESGIPPRKQIVELVTELLKSGAKTVNDLPDVDYSLELATYHTIGRTWRIEREYMRTYVHKGAANV